MEKAEMPDQPMDLSSLLNARLRQHPGSTGWVLDVTPPVPDRWPEDQLVYYVSARRLRPGLLDGKDIAVPWARADQRGNVTLLTDGVTLLGTEGIRPMTRGEVALSQEVERAGPLEELWPRATRDREPFFVRREGLVTERVCASSARAREV
jgi:hypothetical protein